MPRLTVHLVWPGGNTTAIVAEGMPREQQAAAARAIMRQDPTIEQVGFFERPVDPGADIRLQMMGGEFCGNAARCAGYVWGAETGNTHVRLEVSGLSGFVDVDTRPDRTTLRLPGSFFLDAARADHTIVDLAGIRHVIVEGKGDATTAGELIRRYRESHPAVGIMYLQRAGQALHLTPFVWVRETDTLIPETACGSGTIAVAVAEHGSTRTAAARITQPTGETYSVRLHHDGSGLQSIELTGAVKYLGQRVHAIE